MRSSGVGQHSELPRRGKERQIEAVGDESGLPPTPNVFLRRSEPTLRATSTPDVASHDHASEIYVILEARFGSASGNRWLFRRRSTPATASRSRQGYLISPDPEADERIGPERRAYRDVDRIAASCHQHSPDPRYVVPWVEEIPASSEIRFEPSGEVPRAVGRRCAHVAEIAGAVSRRNVHAAAKGNSKMCVIAADPAPFVERFPGCSCGAGMLITE